MQSPESRPLASMGAVSDGFSVHITRVIHCSVDYAFRFMCDLENDAKWWKGTKESVCTSSIRWGVGTTYRQRHSILGIDVSMDIEVIELRIPERMRIRTAPDASIAFVAAYEFEEAEGGVRVSMHGEVQTKIQIFTVMGPMFRVYLRRQATLNFDRLQRCLEAPV